MKSRVLAAADPGAIDISAMLQPVQIDEQKLERDLRRVTTPYIRWQSCETVEEGDVVLCRMESQHPRFQRASVRLSVGSGMFHRALEHALLGMKVNTDRVIRLSEGEVKVTLMELTRRVVPQPDDVMIAALGLEGITTVEAYRLWLRDQQLREAVAEAAYAPAEALTRRVIENSEFVLDRRDWEKLVTQSMERVRILFRLEGKELEQCVPEDFEGRIPVRSYHELLALEQQEGWERLCLYLLGTHWAETAGYSPTEEAYEQYLREYATSWHCTDAEAREITPWDAYQGNEYILYAMQHLRELVEQQLMALSTQKGGS